MANFSKSFNLIIFLFAFSVSAEQVKAPKGTNDLFTYNMRCVKTISLVNGVKGLDPLDAKNLVDDTQTLDNIIKIITDESEETDFRLQVFSPAEAFRQSIIHSLGKLKPVDSRLADKIVVDCQLQRVLEIPISGLLNQLFMRLLIGEDVAIPEQK